MLFSSVPLEEIGSTPRELMISPADEPTLVAESVLSRGKCCSGGVERGLSIGESGDGSTSDAIF